MLNLSAAAGVPSRSWRMIARRQRTGRSNTTGRTNELRRAQAFHQSARDDSLARQNYSSSSSAESSSRYPWSSSESPAAATFERSFSSSAGSSRHFASAAFARSLEQGVAAEALSNDVPSTAASTTASSSSSSSQRPPQAVAAASISTDPPHSKGSLKSHSSSSKASSSSSSPSSSRSSSHRFRVASSSSSSLSPSKVFEAQVQSMNLNQVRRHLGALLSTPEESRAPGHPSKVWYLYRRLAIAEDANDPQLGGDDALMDLVGRPIPLSRMDRPFLARVLRQCVPGPVPIRRILAARTKRTTQEAPSIQAVTVYDWEPRLRDVIGRIEALSAQEAKDGGEGSSSGASHWASPADYEFVFQQFAYSGHLVGSEQLWRQLRSHDVPITKRSSALRLATLAKWLSVRVAIRKRFEATFAPERRKKAFGDGVKIAAAKRRPFFPPEVARLFHEALSEAPKANDPLPFRKLAYDHLLRAAKEAGLEGATTTILRMAYGVDLNWPDVPVAQIDPALLGKLRSAKSADSEWVDLIPESSATSSSSAIAPITTHTINTLMHMLVAKGDIWKAVQTLDVLSHPRGKSASMISGRPRRIAAANNHLETIGRFTQNPRPVSAVEEDDEPLTLTEALRREEQSGQRLGVFGGKQSTEDLAEAAEAEEPVEETPAFPNAIRFDDFLSPVPTPLQVASEFRSSDYVFHLPPYTPNTTTFAVLIEGAARWGASTSTTSSVDLRRDLLELAVQLFNHAAREQAEQRSAYIRAQLNIRAAKSERTDVDEWKQARLHALHSPTISVDGDMLSPIFSAIYMSAFREPGSARLVAQLLEGVEDVLTTLREERQVLFGEEESAPSGSDLTLNTTRHLRLLERQMRSLEDLLVKERQRAAVDDEAEKSRHQASMSEEQAEAGEALL